MGSDFEPDDGDVDMVDNDQNFDDDLEAELEEALASNDEDDGNDEEGEYYYGGGGQDESQTFEGDPVEPLREEEHSYEVEEFEVTAEDDLKQLAEESQKMDAVYNHTESELLDLLSQVPEIPGHLAARPEHHHIPTQIKELVSPPSRVRELEEEIADLYYQIEGSGGFKEQIASLEDTIHQEELSEMRIQLELMARDRDSLRKELEILHAHGTEDPQIGYAFRSDGTYDFDFFSTPFPTDHARPGAAREKPNVILVSPRRSSDPKTTSTGDEEYKLLKEKYEILEELYNELVREEASPPLEDNRAKLKASEEKIKELQEEISFFAKQITESEAERISLLGKAKEDSEQLATWQTRLDDEAERSVQLIQDYAQQISLKDAEIRKLTDDISALQSQHELLVLSQQEFINQPRETPDEKDHKIKEYEAKIQESNAKTREYEQKIESQKETIQNLTASLSSLQDTLRESISTNSATARTFPLGVSPQDPLRQDSTTSISTPTISPSTTDPEPQSLHLQLLEKEQEIENLREVENSYSNLRDVYQRDMSQLQSKIEETKQQGKALVTELQRRLSESRRGRISLQDKVLALGGSVENPLLGTPAERGDPMEAVRAGGGAGPRGGEELERVREENVNLLTTITNLNKVLRETSQKKDGLLEKLNELSKRFENIVKENTSQKHHLTEQESSLESQKQDLNEKIRTLESEHLKSTPSPPTDTQKIITELEALNASLLQKLAAQPILPNKSKAKKPTQSKPKSAQDKPRKPRHPAQPPEPPTPRPDRSKRTTRNPRPVYTYPSASVLTGRVTKGGKVGKIGKGKGVDEKGDEKVEERDEKGVEKMEESPLEPEFGRDPDWKEGKGGGLAVAVEVAGE